MPKPIAIRISITFIFVKGNQTDLNIVNFHKKSLGVEIRLAPPSEHK